MDAMGIKTRLVALTLAGVAGDILCYDGERPPDAGSSGDTPNLGVSQRTPAFNNYLTPSVTARPWTRCCTIPPLANTTVPTASSRHGTC